MAVCDKPLVRALRLESLAAPAGAGAFGGRGLAGRFHVPNLHA